MIVINNLSKSFGKHTLFDSVSFRINPGERAGLVGRNGHGKTTLFRIITGEEQPDDGEVVIPRDYRIGYLKQHLNFTHESTLLEAAQALPAEERESLWKAEKILSGLGFSNDDMKLPPAGLSGGFQVRLSLARVLLSDPDLLLLDEPNNYLDITSIRWLRGFLASWKSEMLLITHDRDFMDRVVTHTLGIHRMKIRKIEGSTDKLYSQIAQDEEIYEKTRQNDEQRRKEVERFISRFRAKARLANMVQSRVKMLEKMENNQKLESIKNLDFEFLSKPFHGKSVMALDRISFSYSGGNPLIENLSINISSGDRICVIGKNGKGKTTLLKVMAGMLKPQNGEVHQNQNADMGYYEQSNVESLNRSLSVVDEIMKVNKSIDRQKAWDISGAMMFSGEDALKKINVLSGGEKSRVMLGKLLASPLNLLILDEPTNHLDMESCDALLAALDNFSGAVVMVTHNEMFLNALARRLVVFQGGSVSVFEGSYSDFLDKVGWKDEVKSEAAVPGSEEDISRKQYNKKEIRKKRSEIISERSRALKPLEEQMSRLEKKIESGERDLEELNNNMITASQNKDSAAISRLSREHHQNKTALDKLYDELEELTSRHEEESKKYDALLKELEVM